MSAIQKLLTDHIDIWTAADSEKRSGRGRSAGNAASVYGIKKLRELILELAVRGKLVPQDPNDEPASELLKRIMASKAKLIAEGHFKKDKPLPPVNEEQEPYQLPVSWEWVRLGAITNFGVTEKLDSISDNTWVLDLEDIEKDTSKLIQKARFSERNSLSAKNSFQAGDVLYGKLRPYLNKVIVADEAGVCTTEILPVRCFGEFCSDYFKLALKSPCFIDYVNVRSYGMKMPRLGTEDGRKALFPLPPLAEQHRIVTKVDELMALCDQLEAQHNNAADAHEKLVSHLLGTLTQSQSAADFSDNWQRIAAHFDTLFTTEDSIDALKQTLLQLAVMGKLVPQDPNDEPASDLLKRIEERDILKIDQSRKKVARKSLSAEDIQAPFSLPSGWAISRLDAITDIQGGIAKGKKIAGKKTRTLPYLRVANVQRAALDLSVIKEIEIAEDEIERYLVRHRDLLITEGGDWDKVGRTAIWDGGINPMAHQNHIFRARIVIEDQNENWLEKYLNSRFAREYFADSSKQTTNLASINMTQLRNCIIPMPPLNEQHRIVNKIDELMLLCDRLNARIAIANKFQNKLADVIVEQSVV
jgi:type I restriction enzyme, S subunit